MMGLAVHRAGIGIGPAGGGGLLLTDLVAHWDLTEASGTRADSHVNGYDLTDNNTVLSSTGVDGVSTSASFAHGSAEYLSAASQAGFKIDDSHWMLNAWFYYVQGSTNSPGLVCKGNAGLSGGEWSFRGPDGGDTDPFVSICRVRNSADSGAANADAGGDADGFNRSTWYMVSVVHNPDANTIAVYRNGVSIKSTAITGGAYASGSNDLTLGSIGAGAYTTGRLQSVSIWKGAGAQTALAERAWLYNAGAAARLYADLEAYSGLGAVEIIDSRVGSGSVTFSGGTPTDGDLIVLFAGVDGAVATVNLVTGFAWINEQGQGTNTQCVAMSRVAASEASATYTVTSNNGTPRVVGYVLRGQGVSPTDNSYGLLGSAASVTLPATGVDVAAGSVVLCATICNAFTSEQSWDNGFGDTLFLASGRGSSASRAYATAASGQQVTNSWTTSRAYDALWVEVQA